MLAAANPFNDEGAESLAALQLGQKLAPAGRDREKMAELMDTHWEDIYQLADLVSDRHVRTGGRAKFPEPIVERLERASTEFDTEWKDKILEWKAELSVLK